MLTKIPNIALMGSEQERSPKVARDPANRRDAREAREVPAHTGGGARTGRSAGRTRPRGGAASSGARAPARGGAGEDRIAEPAHLRTRC